jgi:hypothetical protein
MLSKSLQKRGEEAQPTPTTPVLHCSQPVRQGVRVKTHATADVMVRLTNLSCEGMKRGTGEGGSVPSEVSGHSRLGTCIFQS